MGQAWGGAALFLHTEATADLAGAEPSLFEGMFR